MNETIEEFLELQYDLAAAARGALSPPEDAYPGAASPVRPLVQDRPEARVELREVLALTPTILTERECGVLMLHALSVDDDGVPNYEDIATELSEGKTNGGDYYRSILLAMTRERGVRAISRQAIAKTVKTAQQKLRSTLA